MHIVADDVQWEAIGECFLDTVYATSYVEAVSKLHLTLKGCVENRFKMLEY